MFSPAFRTALGTGCVSSSLALATFTALAFTPFSTGRLFAIKAVNMFIVGGNLFFGSGGEIGVSDLIGNNFAKDVIVAVLYA